MRIYFYFGSWLSGRGGVETVLSSVCKGLIARGHDVKVILAKPSLDRKWEESLPIFYLNQTINDDLREYGSPEYIYDQTILLQRILKKFAHPNILIGINEPWNVAVLKIVAESLSPSPKVLSWAHFSAHKLNDISLYKFGDAHIAICNEIKNQLSDLGITDHIYTSYNPVPQQSYTIPRPSTPHFLYIGRIDNNQKRIDKLINSLSEISGDWKLTIIGEGPDTEMLKALSNERNILNKIEWKGWISNPWESVKEATTLILPSDFEGFGMVLVEALSRGVPVISSNCPTGPSEIIQHNINGWLFETDNINELKNILSDIIEKKITLPSAEICKSSVEKFNLDKVISNFEQIFSDICQDKYAKP